VPCSNQLSYPAMGGRFYAGWARGVNVP
jgi:hypothetical protein